MSKNNVIDFKKPEIDDPITDILRQGARQLLTAALEAEIDIFLQQYRDTEDGQGCQRVVQTVTTPNGRFKPASVR